MTVQILEGIRVTIDKQEILRLQGRQKNEKPSAAIQDILDAAMTEFHHLLMPRAISIEMKTKVMKESINLENGLILHNPDGAKAWQNAEHLAAVVCTIGPGLGNRVAELSAQGASTAALMLDSIGSVAVESVADYVNSHICHGAAHRGMQTGPRLSPGYGTWPLEDQKVIFTMVPAERIGVHLNEQGIMIPMKSVSFCVGMGSRLKAPQETDPCQHCHLKNCKYRKALKGKT
jgi:hypothetical protein